MKTSPFHQVLIGSVAALSFGSDSVPKAEVYAKLAKSTTIPPAEMLNVQTAFQQKLGEFRRRDASSIGDDAARKLTSALQAGVEGVTAQIDAYTASKNGGNPSLAASQSARAKGATGQRPGGSTS